ncbi:MAG TPA: group II intron reverse transcriptase/maturase [Candidatus Obscuribacterales bacterium]
MEKPSSSTVSTKLQRIAKLAKEAPDMVITSLSHHVDVEFLKEAFDRTRKDGAVGVDGVTAEQYEQRLEENLESLLNRFKSGTYKAPPVRRVHIPKAGTDKTRPIGIPAFEDKVLQQAVKMLLEAVYEQDFLPCSYGYRPSRRQHMALEQVWKSTMDAGGGWVIEADIRDFFGKLQHQHLRCFLDQRVRDGVVRRTIGKWLNAGVMEFGKLSYPEDGTPQGGVISPILANIYLHEVLDKWFESTVKPLMRGRATLVRYADDFVCIFELEDDARRVMKALTKRFAKYGLTLHPDKTRLIDFRKPMRPPKSGTGGDSGSFDFLGLQHHWGTSMKGKWCVKQKTSKSRLKRALAAITEWCRKHRHEPVRTQREKLAEKVRGHDVYYGVTGNAPGLYKFHRQVERIWHKWLNRRSQKRSVTWDKFKAYLRRFPLPKPKVYASALKA